MLSTMPSLRRHFRAGLGVFALIIGTVLASAVPAAAAAPTPMSTYTTTHWVRDYHDGFTRPLSDKKWGRYGWGDQRVNNGAMGVYKPQNVYTHDGVLVLRTRYANGQWTSAGVSGKPGFAASGGKWEVRAKMPTAKGIGYVFLLMPTDGSWPPEVDIAEGRVNGRVESFYHWGTQSDHHRAMSVHTVNTHKWHTYGAIFDNDRMIFTIDGTVTGILDNVPVTKKRMWLGFQTGAMDPHGSASAYETIDGGVPNALTPASSKIKIAWVSHYHS
jgi:beta-glucanase (GH16 family)